MMVRQAHIQKGWEYKKLGDAMHIARGGSPRPIKQYLTDDPNGLNWIKIGDATESNKYIYKTKEKITKDGLHKTRFVEEGDFLLSNSMSFGRPYIMKTTGCIHDGWLVLKEIEDIDLDKDFLYHLLCSPYLFEQFDKLAAGSTVRNLNIALVSSVEIPIPPLAEQKRIVAKLDECFEAIHIARANVEKNLNNAKELFQSQLNQIFSQLALSEAEGKGYGWVEKKLGEVCEISMGQSPKGTSYNQNGEGVPLINGPVEFGKNPFSKTVKSKFTTEPTKMCKEGDLILCVRGSTTGRINIAGFEACIGRGVASIRYSENQIWLNYYIRAKRNEIYNLGTGSTFPNVSSKILSNLSFPIPPFKIQAKLVKLIDKLSSQTQSLESNYRQELNALDELKKSILQKAFMGEL